jgi:hypothetical protein
VSIGPDYLRRVVYAKYLMAQAYSLWKRGGDFQLAQAVLLAHDSTEMLMRVIADYKHTKVGDGFLSFWDEIEKKTHKEPPHKGQMDRFNSVRGAFKHKGILPNAADVGDLMPIVRSFCEEITETYLRVKSGEISLADLILSDKPKQLLKDSEAAKASGDISNALTYLGLAYDLLIREAVKKSDIDLLPTHFEFSYFAQQEAMGARVLKEAEKALSEVGEVVNKLILNIDSAKSRRFTWLTPVRHHMASGDHRTIWTHDPTQFGDAEYEFCYEFVLECALKLSAL